MGRVSPRHGFNHAISRVLHYYADWRIGATEAEKRCYKYSDSILLTFDDYGTPEQVGAILSILETKNVKAIFFLQGDWANDRPELVDSISKAGHIIGNHTFSHPNLLKLTNKAVTQEIIMGPPGIWFRAPQGRYNKKVRTIAAGLGFRMCYWTIDSRDWNGTSRSAMRHTILTELHPGAVILFHIHGKHTIELLSSLIDDIRKRGYELTNMDEYWAPRTEASENSESVIVQT